MILPSVVILSWAWLSGCCPGVDGGSRNDVVEVQSSRQERGARPRLVVRVVDEEGVPQARVPVGILVKSAYDAGVKERRLTRETRGEAVWVDVFRRLETKHGEQHFLTFDFPLADAPRIRLRPTDDFPEPITLVLPPTGSLHLRLDPESVDQDEVAKATWREGDERVYFPSIQDLRDPLGAVFRPDRVRSAEGDSAHDYRFPRVGLDLELGVEINFGRELQPLTGPKEADQEIELVLEPHRIPRATWSRDLKERLSPSDAVVMGRVFGADGTPLGNNELSWRATREDPAGATRHSFGELLTDARGHFSLRLRTGALDEVPGRLLLYGTGPRRPQLAWRCELPAIEAMKRFDAGDLAPAQGSDPILLRVVGPGGAALDGAWVTVAQPGTGRATTQSSDALGNVYLERGVLQGGDFFTVSVHAEGYFDLELPCSAPPHGVMTLRLESTAHMASLSGSLILPRGSLQGRLHGQEHPVLWLENLNDPGQPAGRTSYACTGDMLEYTIDEVRPGDYLLHVAIGSCEAGSQRPPRSTHQHPLRQESSAAPPAVPLTLTLDESRRLPPVDLSEELRCLRLRAVTRPGGPPLRGALLDVAGRPWVLSGDQRGVVAAEFRVFTFAESLDAQLHANGFLPLELKELRADRELLLRPTHLPVLLKLEAPPSLPDGAYELQLTLVPVHGDEDSRESLRRRPTKRQGTRQQGVEYLVDGAGEWAPRWELARTVDGRTRRQRIVPEVAPPTIHVLEVAGRQEFVVAAPGSREIAAARGALGG